MSATPARPVSPAKLALPLIGLAGSIAVLAYGALMTARTMGALTTALDTGAATAADVYGGQSWVVVWAAVLGAGIIGTVVAISALAVLVGFGALRGAAVEPVPVDEADAADDYVWDDDEPAASDAPDAEADEATPTRELAQRS
ncbi:hypothetical protein [Agromyces mangrovi Wang et al. 2018]|uniref:hypothetical protein n=1 Tax=Agromyces mangrovi TaxID=1858653 RepID=UPI002573B853|nr:hypothetical protein [Agromyces mangrovi]BDZ64452.1 hypothetical protein GCM10025877_13900 [Agromyces mangrovi]